VSSSKTAPRGALGIIFLIVFLDLMGMGILIPIIPFVVQPYRADALTVGLLALAFSAAQFVASPYIGVWSDRIGRRPVLLTCVLGGALGYAMFGWANSLAVLFMSRILAGATAGSISTAQAYIADISDPKDRAKNFGLIGAAFGLGFILGPALGGILSKISLSAPSYAAAIMSLITFTVATVLLKESNPPEHRAQHTGGWAAINPFTQIRLALDQPAFRTLMLAIFALNAGMTGLQTNFAVFTHARFGLNAAQNAVLYAFLGVMAAITQGLLLRKLAPRVNDRHLIAWSAGAFAAGQLILASSMNVTTVYVSIVFTALGFGLAGPTLIALVSQRADPREQGTLLGTAQSMASFTRVVGPVWAGLLFDHVGHGAPYVSGAAFAILALLWSLQATRTSV
jgi:multidrug resistance protein